LILFFISFFTFFENQTTILSGSKKSSIAFHSLKNSGFETTSNHSHKISATSAFVQTGTVDLMIIIFQGFTFCLIEIEALWIKSLFVLHLLSCGVPTAIKIISQEFKSL